MTGETEAERPAIEDAAAASSPGTPADAPPSPSTGGLPSIPERRAVSCWVLTDARRGIENQAVGLAEAVGRRIPLDLSVRRAKRSMLPVDVRSRLVKPAGLGLGPSPAWPDLVIGCGRASLPYTENIRRWSNAGSLVVQIQHPQRPLAAFDLVLPPFHDAVSGANVMSLLGSPNRITAHGLATAAAELRERIQALPPPRAAVMVGGDSKRHKMTRGHLAGLIEPLERLTADGATLMITTSRRTPPFAVAELKRRFAGRPDVWLWTGAPSDGPNPYFAFLASATTVIVTEDSTNMITEAASAGKPVLIADLEGKDGKFALLYAELYARRLARPFRGRLEYWETEPLAETDRAADRIVAMLRERRIVPAA